MSDAGKRVWRRSLPWLGLAAVAVAVLAVRLQVSFDISAFFPQQASLAHEVLLEQFRNGPGSRILVVGINGANRDQRANASDEMRAALSDDAAFLNVLNGEFDDDIGTPPEPIASYYLLMRDIEISRESLQQVIDARLQDLGFGGGSAILELFARDPYLATLDILERLSPAEMTGDMWFAEDDSAVLLLETKASAVDLAAQARAIARVHEVFAAVASDESLSLELTGAGAFGVELQETIRSEAQKRSLLASTALLLVLLVFYRRPRYLLLASIPIGMGFLVGLMAVSLVFDSVHGITLAFGFTLMGVAIDYPLHLFSQAKINTGDRAIESIWPTLRLGAFSTAVAYSALAFSGSDGLAQLGVFTAVGILVAVFATRYWLPCMLGETALPEPSGSATAVKLRLLPAAGVLLLATLVTGKVIDTGLWDNRLTSLSPVSEGRLLRDNVLRSAAATSDMRHQIIVYDTSLDSLLDKSEALDRRLQLAADEGSLLSWQSVTQILPSAEVQARRQAAIPSDETLRAWLAEITSGSLFRADAFDAFATSAESARRAAPMTAKHISTTSLRSWLDTHLLQVGDHWVAMVSVREPVIDELAKRLSDWDEDGVMLLDLRQSSADLMRDYRNSAITTVSLAGLIILLMLWYQRRQLRQVVWITLTVTAVLLGTVMSIVLAHGQLTVIHLVALLLVLGLGLDYALFLSRRESRTERRATDKAVLVCAVSTTLAFGLLAGSSIPVLRFLGFTVAVGSALSYVVAVTGSRVPGKKSRN